MKHRILGQMAAGALLLSFAAMAQAQWMWVNERGVKQFSDRPPPADVPQSRILKAPPGQATAKTATPAPASSGDDAGGQPQAAGAAPKAAPTLTERNAEFNKRRVEASEKEQKSAQEASETARKAEQCKGLKGNLAAMESGVPTYKRDEAGGRTYYTEAEQARRIKEDRASVAANCR